MERRTFLSVIGGAGLAAGASFDGGLALTAIAAEHLPHTAILHNPPAGLAAGIFEVRAYEADTPAPGLLAQHSIRLLEAENSELLFWFPDLMVRDACWCALTADPEWGKARLGVTRISLYEPWTKDS